MVILSIIPISSILCSSLAACSVDSGSVGCSAAAGSDYGSSVAGPGSECYDSGCSVPAGSDSEHSGGAGSDFGSSVDLDWMICSSVECSGSGFVVGFAVG